MMNPRPVLFLMLIWISVFVLLQGCALIPTATTTATASGSYQTYKTITIAKKDKKVFDEHKMFVKYWCSENKSYKTSISS